VARKSSATKNKNGFKGTVSIILSGPSCKDGDARFKNSILENNLEDFVVFSA